MHQLGRNSDSKLGVKMEILKTSRHHINFGVFEKSEGRKWN